MAKHGKHGSGRESSYKDNPIGLTGAFDPISVDTNEGYDDPVGLTQAFGPVEDVETRQNWDTSEKWDGFDWSTPVADAEADSAAEAWKAGAAASSGGRHARHARKNAEEAQPADDGKPKVSARMEKSRKTRKRLVVTVILLLIVVAALGVGGYRLLTGSWPFVEQPAVQVEEETSEAPAAVAPSDQDTQEVVTQKVDIPELASLFGKTQDDAIKQIAHGALVTSTTPISDEGSVIKQTVTVELSDEPGNPRSGGSPKVYLGLNEDGKIVQVGYSAPAGLLGYGTLNFQDAVAKEHIIEKTLQAIGANVEEGTVALPKKEKDYTTYDADGTTVMKERYSFDGDVDVDGIPCSWSAVLSYDYTSANISGNASETVRLMYVYLTQK